MNIPFLSFRSTNATIKMTVLQAFEDFFDKESYVLGENVKQFESDYASFNNVSECVGVSNGLDALHIALKTLGIGIGDEVILPSNTYIATALAVSNVGATPVFVEPDIRTYNIDPDQIQCSITSKTKVIIPVHLYGQACEMGKIMEIVRAHDLLMVEDNAQSQGATYDLRFTGTFGNINATSFYPGKNLGALGDAGAVTTNNRELGEKARLLRNYGSNKKYYNEVLGYNMRLDECQALFLSIKLKYLPVWTEMRQEIASLYDAELNEVGDLILPWVHPASTHVYHLYVIRSKYRDALQRHLTKHDIATLIHYPVPPHLQNAYNHLGYFKGSFPNAEEIASTCLSLPMWPGMKKEDVCRVCQEVRRFFDFGLITSAGNK